jgi:hypothetical protein
METVFAGGAKQGMFPVTRAARAPPSPNLDICDATALEMWRARGKRKKKEDKRKGAQVSLVHKRCLVSSKVDVCVSVCVCYACLVVSLASVYVYSILFLYLSWCLSSSWGLCGPPQTYLYIMPPCSFLSPSHMKSQYAKFMPLFFLNHGALT